MQLIIAEKPMLARAIADAIPGRTEQKNGYTVKGGYTIVSAFGHLLTLKEPEDYDAAKYRRWSLSTLPIYFENWGKKPGDGKEERLNLIGELLKSADSVIHAGDPDEEGQYLIDEILEWFRYEGPVYRLSTGDTTEAALAKSLAKLGDNKDYVNLGRSAHARSVADIMVGFNFSRYFTLKNPQVTTLTVGRVQTPTLGLVVTRDLAIENHKKQGYYNVYAELDVDGRSVTARFEPEKNDPRSENGRITDGARASELVKRLKGASLPELRVSVKSVTEQPPLPFNLVKLQTYCSNKFGYEPSETLAITQSLRDNHNAITYNRSDCRYLSEEQFKLSPDTIRRVFANLKDDPAGKQLSRFPFDPSLHSRAFDDANITAHTAIIPQNRALDLTKLSEKERNVYLAVSKYYLAQFLPPAEKLRTALECTFEGGMLRAVSTKTVSEGYLKLIRPEKKDDEEDSTENESALSEVPDGTYSGVCTDARSEAKETKAPPRYTKASLNEDMTRIARYVTDPEAKALLLQKDKDKKGENGSIGTSATRASIIDNLEKRGFIETRGKQIRSTQLGRELYRILPEQLKKPDMTGLWWAVQESVREGTLPWTALTDSVLEMIREVLATEYPRVDAFLVPESMRRGRLPLGPCPRCGAPVIEGNTGFGCSGYQRGCRFVIPKKASSGPMSKTELKAEAVHTLLSGGWQDELWTDGAGRQIPTGKKRTVNVLTVKRLYSQTKDTVYEGTVFLTDGDSAEGPSFVSEKTHAEIVPTLGKCPRCGADVTEGRLGFGCTRFREGCRFTIWKRSKMKLLTNVEFTKEDAKKILAGKPVKKQKLVDKKGNLFTAKLVLEDDPEKPWSPVFRVVEGTVETKLADPGQIKLDKLYSPPGKEAPAEENA